MITRLHLGPIFLVGLLFPGSLLAQTGPHEARATGSTGLTIAPLALREPPAPNEEIPPAQLAEGSVWIPGYWWWDTDRGDFEWVKGFARIPPPNQEWRPGHYHPEGTGWRWVPGFWAAKPRPVPAQPERVVVLPGVSTPAPEWYAPGGGFFYGPVIYGGIGGFGGFGRNPYYRPYRPGIGYTPAPYTGPRLPTGIGPLPSLQQPFGPLSLPSQPPISGPGPGIGYPMRR